MNGEVREGRAAKFAKEIQDSGISEFSKAEPGQRLSAEDLHFERSQRHLHTIQRTRSGGAVGFLNRDRARGQLHDRAGSLRLLLDCCKGCEADRRDC